MDLWNSCFVKFGHTCAHTHTHIYYSLSLALQTSSMFFPITWFKFTIIILSLLTLHQDLAGYYSSNKLPHYFMNMDLRTLYNLLLTLQVTSSVQLDHCMLLSLKCKGIYDHGTLVL